MNEYLAQNNPFITYFSKTQKTQWKKEWKNIRARNNEKGCEITSSGQDMATAITKSHKLQVLKMSLNEPIVAVRHGGRIQRLAGLRCITICYQ